ncbi:hypothetical protein EK21DRAFT_89907 [Setomelanomma holmii]|uniref:Uncharacterized protein n=1 Tax=Setomelanomma holmii TaxID=210430 RepID=A0A9P4LJL3_9PLEO|nr:hypothetical protein EK21DRAFT_89907 [Setomelanomma holmii]
MATGDAPILSIVVSDSSRACVSHASPIPAAQMSACSSDSTSAPTADEAAAIVTLAGECSLRGRYERARRRHQAPWRRLRAAYNTLRPPAYEDDISRQTLGLENRRGKLPCVKHFGALRLAAHGAQPLQGRSRTRRTGTTSDKGHQFARITDAGGNREIGKNGCSWYTLLPIASARCPPEQRSLDAEPTQQLASRAHT